MLGRKNRFMLGLAFTSVLLGSLVHLLQRSFNFLGNTVAAAGGVSLPSSIQNVIMLVPILLWCAACLLYRAHATHRQLPMLVSSTLIAACLSSIVGSGGVSELHFLFFAVIAIIAYYRSIPLVMGSAFMIAVIQIVGWLLHADWLIGTVEYQAGLWLLHAAFFFMTTAAAVMKIRFKQTAKQTFTLIESAASLQDTVREPVLDHAAHAAESDHKPDRIREQSDERRPQSVHQASNLEKAMREFEQRAANSSLPTS